ncbi:hypothetical protein ACFPOI_00655 [Nonomuraea angiospora]|uniref:Uncharacterized protein n=1 Tax=Nonomuraea angiospora TaxID=46172 RepID=A0ABR9M216_9ACTN|nr:hypothetical protein [Nonomuraea angiospora]MBE1586913.1 hypothetical protein [Nonomuraea angiospora]
MRSGGAGGEEGGGRYGDEARGRAAGEAVVRGEYGRRQRTPGPGGGERRRTRPESLRRRYGGKAHGGTRRNACGA